MLIDASHRRWAWASVLGASASLALYGVYRAQVAIPTGGSWPGLAFGAVGFALMLYAGLLGARKKVRIWRLGRAQTWMRGHLWLGALSFPVILLHAGFDFGSGLTAVLMWLFVIVTVSGLAGAWIQHTVPRRLLSDVPMETIYDQIGHVRAQLLAEADTVVAGVCGRLDIETVAPVAPLREFYVRDMRPFVETPRRDHPLAQPPHAALRFEKVRALVPSTFHAAIADLENICEEQRQLMRQSRMHTLLYAWQLVHVPLSIALLLLAAVHVVAALRY